MTRLARFALILGLSLASVPAAAQERPARPARVATIEFLDVGQGDAILIRSPEGKTALVDAGPHKELAADLLRSSRSLWLTRANPAIRPFTGQLDSRIMDVDPVCVATAIRPGYN